MMHLTSWIQDGLNGFLRSRGKEIIRSEWIYDWQRGDYLQKPLYNPMALPAQASQTLRPDNPRLVDLQQRYARFNPAVTTPLVWREGHLRPEDIAYFRGDNAYVWQVRGNMNIMGYGLTNYYVQSLDRAGLLDKLKEDESFGNFPFEIGGRKVSRDLLDSLTELYFLDRHLGLMSRQDFTILDIGAGYGRLAYRASEALSGLKQYLCTDGVPFSTFISEFYLRYRQVHPRAMAVPLDEIEATLQTTKPDLAINIHSFSECRTEAIEWWVSLLARTCVKHFMIAPNATNCGGEWLRTNDLKDFSGILAKHGYKQIVKEPKYRDPVVQQYGISPTWHFLFELT